MCVIVCAFLSTEGLDAKHPALDPRQLKKTNSGQHRDPSVMTESFQLSSQGWTQRIQHIIHDEMRDIDYRQEHLFLSRDFASRLVFTPQ